VSIGGAAVHAYAKGDYFGELALLRAAPRAATVCSIVCIMVRASIHIRTFGSRE
jgi:CRP-like cAMP-binding protein